MKVSYLFEDIKKVIKSLESLKPNKIQFENPDFRLDFSPSYSVWLREEENGSMSLDGVFPSDRKDELKKLAKKNKLDLNVRFRILESMPQEIEESINEQEETPEGIAKLISRQAISLSSQFRGGSASEKLNINTAIGLLAMASVTDETNARRLLNLARSIGRLT